MSTRPGPCRLPHIPGQSSRLQYSSGVEPTTVHVRGERRKAIVQNQTVSEERIAREQQERVVEVKRAGRLAMVLVVLALTMALGWAGIAVAAPGQVTIADRDAIIRVGQDIYVAPGETVETVVAIGGRVTLAGTVRNAVVAIGGDVVMEPTSSVGGAATPADVAVVTVGGRLITQNGAQLMGKVVTTADGWAVDLFDGWLFNGVNGLNGFNLVGNWIAYTIFFVVVALLATLIMPRHLVLVRDRVKGHFWACLGWGALTGIILIPLASIILLITVVGVLALIPGLLIALPVVLFFGFVAMGAWLGERVLGSSGGHRENLLLAAVVGVAIFSLLNLVPVAGGMVLGVVWLVGLGATVLAIKDGWKRRRQARLAAAAGPVDAGVPAPQPPAVSGAQPPAETIA